MVMSEYESQQLEGGDTTPERHDANADSSLHGTAVSKSCCVCGVDLHGRTRFKDGQGRYWCPGCNEKDEIGKQPAVCPDCNASMIRADLVEFKGTPVCKPCWDKRKLAAKREEARLRAVEEAIREEQEKKRRLRNLGLAGAAMVAAWAVIMLIFLVIKWAHH
jgi:hypothetical protein